MKKILGLILAGAMLATPAAFAADAGNSSSKAPQTLDQLLQQVRNARSEAAAENRRREQEFLAAKSKQQEMLQQAKAAEQAQEQRSTRLQKTFDNNEQALTELHDTLRTRMGNLGEVFGVVRQVAGDVKSVVDSSLVSAQIPNRGEFLSKLAQSKALPSIDELEQLWITMQEEATASSKVVKFPATVVAADGGRNKQDVVRVGEYVAITGDKFLRYNGDTDILSELPRQPAGRYQDMADELFNATGQENVMMAVDPTRGQLLGMLVDTPTFMERVQQGGYVGYVTIALGFIGILVALERLVYLFMAGSKIKAQLNSSQASGDNALGRVLAVYSENKTDDVETLELKLDEAIMREVPALEARLGFLKLVAAVGPLLGLLGTVTGMILTFQSITLFGTGDPKNMASGISQALVTTVIGLCVAIPMVLLHGFVSARARQLVQILEEQSAGIIAAHAEKRK